MAEIPNPSTSGSIAEKELLLRDRAIAAASCGIVVTDALQDNPIIYVNPAFERIFGYTADEVRGKNPRFLHAQDRDQPAIGILREAVHTGKACRVLIRNYRKDGTRILNECHISPVHDVQGQLTNYVGIQTDMTERIKAEDRLQQLHHQNELILNSAGQGIFRLDLDGKTTFINPAGAQLLGWQVQDLLGKPLHALIHHSRLNGSAYPASECPTLRVLRNGQTQQITNDLFWRQDGTSISVDYATAPIREQGQIVGAVVVFRDLTEQRKIEMALLQTKKLSAVGRLAAGVAHELNNPLHSILGFAESLSGQMEGSDPRGRALALIRQEALRCRTLVQNLLTFSRKRLPGISVEDPVGTVEEVLTLIEAQARVRRVEVVRQFDEKLPPIPMDRSQIQQVLINLCSNSLDATPRGGILTVSIALAQENKKGEKGQMVFGVRDNGSGIAPEMREHIFEPFFTTKEVGQGTGLGLSLAYEIVKHHGGDMVFSSELGKGSLFQFYLPLEQPAPAANCPPENPIHTPAS